MIGVMELLGQPDGTILYGDRSAELAQSGGPKVFRAPFRGYIKGITVTPDEGSDEPAHFTIKINGVVVVCDNNSFNAGDTIEVIGAPVPNSRGDRIGLELGTLQ